MNFSNFTNTTNPFLNDAHIFAGSGVAHLIMVIIPTLILGPILFSLLLSDKKLRDPPSILFMCTTVLCIVGPVTYGLLMDVSLITGLPIIGRCGTETQDTFWIFLGLFSLQLLVSTAYLSVAQYITIRWGPKKLSTIKTVIIFFILLAYSFVGGLLNLAYNSAQASAVIVRGSLCTFSFEAELVPRTVAGTLGLLMYIVPAVTIVTVFSALSFRYVKRHTIDNGEVVRDVLIIMITITTSSIVLRFLPIVNLFLFLVDNPTTIDWILVYSIELNYPFFLILTIFVHKSVRKQLFKRLQCSSLKSLVGKPSNQIAPTD